jgi:hypothetical protein
MEDSVPEYFPENFLCIILYIASRNADSSIQKIPSLKENTPSHNVKISIPEKEIKIEIQQ